MFLRRISEPSRREGLFFLFYNSYLTLIGLYILQPIYPALSHFFHYRIFEFWYNILPIVRDLARVEFMLSIKHKTYEEIFTSGSHELGVDAKSCPGARAINFR